MPIRMTRIGNPPDVITVYPRKHPKTGKQIGWSYLYRRAFISEAKAKQLAKKVKWRYAPGVGGASKPSAFPGGPKTMAKKKGKKKKSAPKKGTKKGKRKGGKGLKLSSPKRKGQKPVSGFKAAPGKGKKKKSYKVYKSKRSKPSGGTISTYHAVRVNPSSPVKAVTDTLKRGAVLYGGLLGIRVANGLIKDYVVGVPGSSGLLKSAKTDSALAKAAPYLPAVGGFILGTFIAPMLLKGKHKDWAAVLQAGGVVALLDTIMTNAVIPKLQDAAKDSAGTVDTDKFTYKLSKYLGVGSDGPSELAYYPDQEMGYYPDELGDGMGADPYAVRPRTPYGNGLWVRN